MKTTVPCHPCPCSNASACHGRVGVGAGRARTLSPLRVSRSFLCADGYVPHVPSILNLVRTCSSYFKIVRRTRAVRRVYTAVHSRVYTQMSQSYEVLSKNENHIENYASGFARPVPAGEKYRFTVPLKIKKYGKLRETYRSQIFFENQNSESVMKKT